MVLGMDMKVLREKRFPLLLCPLQFISHSLTGIENGPLQ